MQTNLLWRAVVCAMLLLGLWSCRKADILPTSAPNAVPTEVLQKIQAWYNPKIERLRAQKSSPQNIYLPQWGEGKLIVLPTGERIASFPAHRQASVQYYQIGFVRRFIAKLDAQDNVLEVKLLEMIGKKEYLRTEKDEVVRRFYRQEMNGVKAVAWERILHFTVDKTVSGCSEPIIMYKNFEDCTSIVTINCDGSRTESTPICGGFFNPIDGGTGDVGGGGVGYEGDGGGTISTPCPLCPALDNGDNTPPAQDPPPVSEKLKAILDMSPFQTNINAKSSVWKQIDSVFNEGLQQSPELKRMYDSLVVKGFKTSIDLMQTDNKLGNFSLDYNNNPGKFGIQLDVVLFQDPELKTWLKITLFAELFHGWQAKKYGENTYKMMRNNHMINLETEQRFFMEYIEEKTKDSVTGVGIFKMKHGYTFYRDDAYRAALKNWLLEIKNSPEGKPTWNNMQAKYFSMYTEDWFRKMWAGSSYVKNPTNFNFIPTAIFNFF